MKVFISHAHEEQNLAAAWKTLLTAVAPQKLEVWYSSDPDPRSGVSAGRWRAKLGAELQKAEILLTLLTPESSIEPWLIFECAFAMGRSSKKKVIPVLYYMTEDELPSPLADLQCYRGNDFEHVVKLCEKEVLHNKLTEAQASLAQAYLQHVDDNRREREGRPFLRDKFHAHTLAQQLEGPWFAKWMKRNNAGTEEPWLNDSMKISTSQKRLGIVGTSDSGHFYPMEGVISSQGRVALIYWSRGAIPICGTIFLELIGGNDFMEGVWHGHDGTLQTRLELIGGAVAFGRDEARVKSWTPESAR